MKKSVNRLLQDNLENLSFASFIFFIFLVALMGFGVGCLISAPLFMLGRIWPKAYDVGAFYLQSTARRFIVAPVFRTEVAFDFPGPCLTMSNHRSTLDTFILVSHIPGVRLIAKADLFFIPFLSFVMRVMGQIKVKRGDIDSYWEAIEKAGVALQNGAHVHIFPEMTRCSKGFVGTQRFHLAPFKMAIELQTKIIPVVFFNTDEAWPRGFLKMNRKIVMKAKSLEAVIATDYPNSKALMKEVQQRINQALQSEKKAVA